MKKQLKCSLFLLVFIPVLVFAGKDGEQAEKKINREFSIRTNGRLSVDNKYGDVDIAIGENGKIRIDVTITSKASTLKKAEENLSRVTINFNEGNNHVEATTVYDSGAGNNNTNLKVDYSILVPPDIYLEMKNKYGNIYLEKTDRDMSVDIAYGDIRLGPVNATLDLDMAYGGGSVSNIKQGKMEISYSNLTFGDADGIDLEMKYTDVVMGSATRMRLVSGFSDLKGKDIDEVNYSGKYDDIYIERVKQITAESAYTGIKTEGLMTSGKFDMRYGDLSVSNIGSAVSSMDINTSYTGVVLKFVPEASFTVDAKTNYCDVRQSGLKMTEHIEKGSETILKGTRGNGGGLVMVRMNYGELKIN